MTNLVDYRKKINRININRKFEKEQEKIDELFEKDGLTDEVLEMQVTLNEQRHQENISSNKRRIYEHYVQ